MGSPRPFPGSKPSWHLPPYLITVPMALVLLLVAQSMSPASVSLSVPVPAAQYEQVRAAREQRAPGDSVPAVGATPTAGLGADSPSAKQKPAPALVEAPRQSSPPDLSVPVERKPCTGNFCSAPHLQPYQGGDLEAPGELEKAVAARSYKGELIITYANAGGSPWVANLVQSIRELGMEHWFIIMMSQSACDGIYRSPLRLSCAWSSWDLDGCKSESTKQGRIERMWFIRHHYLARLVDLGTVNVMALDGDMTIQMDPYPYLHEPTGMGAHNFVLSLDNGASATMINNGFMYLRGCKSGGETQMVLLEMLQRERDVCRHPEVFTDKGPFWTATDATNATQGPHQPAFVSAKDQKIYQDVLTSSFCGRHIMLRNAPTSVKVNDYKGYVRHFSGGLSPVEMLDCCRFIPVPLKPGGKPRIQDGIRFWWHPMRLPRRPPTGGIVGLDLRGPNPNTSVAEPVPGAETAAAPNATFISSWHGTMEGEVAGWDGHWAYNPPVVAHFVGGMDKVDSMQALGWWRYEVETLIAGLPRRSSTSKLAAPGETEPTAVGAVMPAMQRHFTHGMPKLLALAGPGASRRLDSMEKTIAGHAARRAWLAVVGGALGRVATDPVIDCLSRWIVRINNTGFGFTRRRFPSPRLGIYQHYDERTGIGAFLGDCAGGFSPAEPHPQGICCYPLFCKSLRERHKVHNIPTVHHRFVEAALARPGARRADVDWAALGLPESGTVSAGALASALAPHAGADVLVIHVGAGMAWPQVTDIPETAAQRLCEDFGHDCHRMARPGRPAPMLPSQWLEATTAKEPGPMDQNTAVSQWIAEHPTALYNGTAWLDAWRLVHARDIPEIDPAVARGFVSRLSPEALESLRKF